MRPLVVMNAESLFSDESQCIFDYDQMFECDFAKVCRNLNNPKLLGGKIISDFYHTRVQLHYEVECMVPQKISKYRKAFADMRQYFSQKHYTPFTQNTVHVLKSMTMFLFIISISVLNRDTGFRQ